MENLFAILLSFLAYSILNVSQATQKDGIRRIREKAGWGWSIWWIGTVGTAVPFFIILAALNIGNVSLVGAMAGTGLPVMTIFSAVVLREEVTRRQVLGILLILGGGVLVGLFAPAATAGEAHFRLLVIISVAIPILLLAVWYLKYRLPGRDAWILGALAGSFAGISVLFQEAATSEAGRSLGRSLEGLPPILAEYAPILLNPISAIWIAATVFAFVSSQFAYARGDSVRVVPPFVAAQILVPLIGGVVAFSESLAVLQWVGIAIILSGLPFVAGRGAASADSEE